MCAFTWQLEKHKPPSFKETVALMLEGKSAGKLQLEDFDDSNSQWDNPDLLQAICNCTGIRELNFQFFGNYLDDALDVRQCPSLLSF
jgi:hypothetical protein